MYNNNSNSSRNEEEVGDDDDDDDCGEHCDDVKFSTILQRRQF